MLGSAVSSVSLSKCQTELLAGTAEGAIFRVRAASMKSVLLCENHSDEIVGVCFPQKVSDRFATCSLDGTVKYEVNHTFSCSMSYMNDVQNVGCIGLFSHM